MELKEIKNRKAILQNYLFHEIRKFERDCGVCVTSVELSKGCLEYGRDKALVTDVTLVVEI